MVNVTVEPSMPDIVDVDEDGAFLSSTSSVLTSRSQSPHSFHQPFDCGDEQPCTCPISPATPWGDDDYFFTAQHASSDPPRPSRQQVFLPAIATMSLGSAGMHSLSRKIEAAAEQGFRGIELFWDDLLAYAAESHSWSRSQNWGSADAMAPLLAAASNIRLICDQLQLTIVSVQPFRNYDGILDKQIHHERLVEFKLWLDVCERLAAHRIGIPSTIGTDPDGPSYTGDPDMIAADLRELALLAKTHNILLAYENLCFGKHTRSWQQAWDVIQRSGAADVIGFLPDTFNLCGEAFGDPSQKNGMQIDAHAKLQRSLRKLTATVPMTCMPFLQVADAEFMDPPLGEDHPWMANCPEPKMAWSRNARLFPGEEGGYLPAMSVVRTLTAAGWSGWVSFEVFSRTTRCEGEETISEHARRAWKSWQQMAKTMHWPEQPLRQGGEPDGDHLTRPSSRAGQKTPFSSLPRNACHLCL